MISFICLICLFATGCAGSKARTVDVDLTKLSNTMVYAKVYNMMTNPSDYIGKTVKASGPYATSYYQDELYHFVLVEGVDACCPEGLMFIWDGEHSYPEDYPEEGTNIEFVGVFNSYDGLDFEYYCFEIDDLVIVK